MSRWSLGTAGNFYALILQNAISTLYFDAKTRNYEVIDKETGIVYHFLERRKLKQNISPIYLFSWSRKHAEKYHGNPEGHLFLPEHFEIVGKDYA